MSRFQRPNIGSIGTAGYQTQRSLIDSFIGELRQQQPMHQTDRELLRSLDEQGTAFGKAPDTLPVLIHSLSRYAPKGYHFGPSDSDPTDFGYWPNEDTDRNEGSREIAERHRAEESIAADTAEQFIAQQFQQE